MSNHYVTNLLFLKGWYATTTKTLLHNARLMQIWPKCHNKESSETDSSCMKLFEKAFNLNFLTFTTIRKSMDGLDLMEYWAPHLVLVEQKGNVLGSAVKNSRLKVRFNWFSLPKMGVNYHDVKIFNE